MKERIKTDGIILLSLLALTGVLYRFPFLFGITPRGDDVLDFFGLLTVFKGVALRMIARGHKKAYSRQGEGLVTTGLYQYIRNPMYLGTFLLGTGFVMIVWPWWTLPIFGGLFFWRFNRQVVKEEGYLKKIFGKDYEQYCQTVPRFFPRWESLKFIKGKKFLGGEDVWSTKEKRGLIAWPLLAFILETLQEIGIFGHTQVGKTAVIFAAAMVVFGTGFYYRQRQT